MSSLGKVLSAWNYSKHAPELHSKQHQHFEVFLWTSPKIPPTFRPMSFQFSSSHIFQPLQFLSRFTKHLHSFSFQAALSDPFHRLLAICGFCREWEWEFKKKWWIDFENWKYGTEVELKFLVVHYIRKIDHNFVLTSISSKTSQTICKVTPQNAF